MLFALSEKIEIEIYLNRVSDIPINLPFPSRSLYNYVNPVAVPYVYIYSTMSSIFQVSSNLKCQDLYAYMKTQQEDMLEKFYNYPTICLAIYR